MNLSSFEKIISLLPDGPKKDALKQKLNQIKAKSKSGTGGGLQDEMSLKPTGHITIEKIDQDGNSLGVIVDQPNLVVNGAEEILLRAFSGDPNRMIYKNRIPKSNPSPVYHIDVNELLSVEANQNVIPHHPNKIWECVNDNDFDIEYSFYPTTVYLEEVESKEPNKKAFQITTTPNASSAPLTSEVYSAYTNLFIGIGDGKNYPVSLNDERLHYEGDFTGDEEKKETSTVNDFIFFKEKISNVALEFEVSNSGGQIEIIVDGVTKETIETYDSTLADGETKVVKFELNNLDHTKETEVKVKLAGADTSVTNPKMVLVGLAFDALTKNMNQLIHEFESYTRKFDTPTIFNTTSVAPYTVKLPNYPIVPESVKVSYNGIEFTQVEDPSELTDHSYVVNKDTGILEFRRALTNLLITYEVTGEVYEDYLPSELIKEQRIKAVTDEVPFGEIDGNNKTFTLSQTNIVNDSETVKLNGAALTKSVDYTISGNQISLSTAPSAGSTLVVSYQHKIDVSKRNLNHSIQEGKVRVYSSQKGFLHQATDVNLLEESAFLVENDQSLVFYDKAADLGNIHVYYYSNEVPGIPTNYQRQIILKPKKTNEYPWYSLDKGAVQFVAEFQEDSPNHNVTIREMGLFDGPRVEDHVKGFTKYPVKAFSLVRVGESQKDTNTGLRITWTITLLNEDGNPFIGGY